MAIYLRKNGRTDWCPDSAEERERRTIINPGYQNEERRYIGTINSTARLLNFLSIGSIQEEDFYDGLSKNAQHIGVSEELLLQLATETLKQESNTKES